MKRCVIVGGADIGNYGYIREQLLDDDYVVFCDSGLKHLPHLRREPDLIVGDFDSHENPQLDAETIVLPVIGDSTLYATGFYLYELWKELVPELELVLLPGISAHCLAAAKSGHFLAMGQEILTIVPATAEPEKIAAALKATDAAAVYKPVALREQLRHVVESAGPWARILRIDRAGLPDQKIYEGSAALDPAEEYLSILLLWRS